MSEPRRPPTGFVNFRDLGGHATPQGHVRSGRLFRSDSLAGCDRDDISQLVAVHGIRTVIDLRREHEVLASPMDGLRAAGVRVEHLSLIDPSVPVLTTPDLVDSTLAERYYDILSSSGEQFATVVRIIADDTSHPLVFQCMAGKDRTGLVAALVLQVLGVDDAAITADYAKTAEVIDLILARLVGHSPSEAALAARIVTAEASTMQAALDWVRDHHGDAAGYLVAHGLTSDEVAALRTSLTDLT